MQQMLDFLAQLEQNNCRDWFLQHRPQYMQAKQCFEQLVAKLVCRLHRADSAIPLTPAKALTFKLMRDTRFSRDKSPYNPAFRAHIGPSGKQPIPVGYFLYLRPGGRSFLGGGLFADMLKGATSMVRDHIADHGDDWQQIIADPDFRRHFTVGGTALKNVPRGYDPGHPQAAYLKNKSWYIECPLTDSQLQSGSFLDDAVEIYLKMRPFHDFLNTALAGLVMPAR